MLRSLLSLFVVSFSFYYASLSYGQEPVSQDDRLFELRVYYPNPGKLEALHNRFREHTLDLFTKQGMEHIGYWVTDEVDPVLVYILALKDEAERETAWAAFIADPEWQAVYKDSVKEGTLVSKVESTLMRPTPYSPKIEKRQASPERIFELRTYKATQGNLGNLDTRFRDHTIELFEKHGASNLAYFHLVNSEEGSENTLIYLLAHDSAASRNEMFKAFRKDPQWQKARKASEERAGGPLTEPNGVTSRLLLPVDYSPIK